MTDEYIGKEFYTISYLKEIYDADDKFIYVCVNDKDEVVAYFYIFTSILQEALRILNIPIQLSGFDSDKLDSKVGVYKTSCTKKDYRNQGLFTSFLHSMEGVFREKRVEQVLLPALRTPSGVVPVKNVVFAAGFHEAGEFMHPWSHIDSYCPYCKNRNCQCDCVLYTKEMAYE